MNLPEGLPEGWIFTHLIFLDPAWQVNLRNEFHVVVATGETPAIAIDNAVEKIFLEEFSGHFRFPEDLLKKPKVNPKTLLESLGLAKPLEITRRKGL